MIFFFVWLFKNIFFAPFGQIAYYVLRRDKPEEWKCQPYQWLPRDLEIHEMVVGWFSLSIGSLISSALACWVMNGGYSTLYFDPAEHGYVWLVLQIPVIFIWQVGTLSLWIFLIEHDYKTTQEWLLQYYVSYTIRAGKSADKIAFLRVLRGFLPNGS